MWDLPKPGIEPMSPALVGRFLTTRPLWKSQEERVLLVGHKQTKSLALISDMAYFYLQGGAAAAKSLQSCLTVRPRRRQPTRLPSPWDSPGKDTGVGCHFLPQGVKVKSESEVTQSCPTLSNPMDCSLPGSSIHGIFQARVLEWVAIAFSTKGEHGDLKKG